MASLYYKIWMDAITNEKSKKVERRNFKLYTLIPISLLQGANLLTVFYWIKAINRDIPLFVIVNIFNAKPLNSFVSIMITYFIPFVILNWLLIYSNDRYKTLLSEYPTENGKIYRNYALITLGLLLIPIIIQKAFFA